MIVRGVEKPCHLEKTEDFEKWNFSEQEDWRITKKPYNLKSEKIIDNLGQVWLDLWDQCTLTLKACVKIDIKFKTAKNKKNTINLLYIMKETCNSTTTINLSQMRMMKVDLNFKSIYGQDMELSKYYNMFAA